MEQDAINYLIEFRKRVIISLGFLTVLFLILLNFANKIYTILALPLLKHLPPNHGLIATNIVAPIYVPIQLTFIVALFIAAPFFLYQIWAFISPALYVNEKKFTWPVLVLSIILFYSGISFAYFVIFPLIFGWLVQTAPVGVMISPDITQYLDFTLKLLITFGLIFEVPIVTLLLIWSGLVTRAKLIAMRPYLIVGAFIFGMLFAPPDVVSQTLLALPLWLLFEAGIVLSKLVKND